MLNKVLLIGNVGKDPEIRYTSEGAPVANFTLATTSKFKNAQGERPTEWHRIVAFGKVAEIIERYVKKGSKLYVEGEIKTRSWKDQSGSTRYITEIHCREITMMGDNSSSQDYQNSPPTSQKVASKSTTQGLRSDDINEEDDDIPF